MTPSSFPRSGASADTRANQRLAYVEGRLQSRTWEAADGIKRRAVEVIADRFQALAARRGDEKAV